MTELTFTKDTDGFYTASFSSDGRCHVQINKGADQDFGLTTFEASLDGTNYATIMPSFESESILALVDLPEGFTVRIKSTTPVQYAAVI